MRRLILASLLAVWVPAMASAQPTNPGTAPTQPGQAPDVGGARTQPGQTPDVGNARTQPGQTPDVGNARTEPGRTPDLGNARTEPAMRQPGDIGNARTEPAMRQIPASEAGFGSNRNPSDPSRNAGEMRQIDQNDMNRMTDERRGNRVQENRQITQRDIDIMRQAERNRQNDAFRRSDPVRQNEQGRDIPTAEQAREMQRQSAEIRRQAEENFQRAAELDRRTADALRNSMERSRQLFQGALDRGLAAANIAMQAWHVLHPSDHTCLSNTSPAAMPIVPSMCAGSAECASCYSEAYGRLDRTRGNLEKLRCIYRWNQEYVERAKSFGDNVSSVHGISGLAWQQERRKIERAFDQMGVTYDGKYRELLGYVRADLGSIGACEARFFDNPDWAVRYGFMFYGFLEDRYRR